MAKEKDSWVENRRHIRNYPHKKSFHISRSVLKSIRRVCRECGETDERKLVIHHINADSLDNSRENLEVLCRGCHKTKTPSNSPYAPFLEYDAERCSR